ncbi:MAG: glycerol kinase [Archaeoglobaceae archaeon]|nr:glycerol kinase [Archaeoglobaceae archaeon]
MIAVIDAGTTSVKLAVCDEKLLEIRKEPLIKRCPYPGWVEIDVEDLSRKAKSLLDYAIEKYKIEAIGITNQRTTVVLWDDKTKSAIFPALGWQDSRAMEVAICLNRNFKIRFGKIIGKVVQKTAAILPTIKRKKTAKWLMSVADFSFIPTHSSVKLRWLLDQLKKPEEFRLKAGTIDSWLIYKLCGEHFTDYSNAGATALFDPFNLKWSETIMEIADIDEELLPDVLESDAIFGEYRNVPITGVIADQSSSLYSLGCWDRGEIKVTNGTGSFVDLNVGGEAEVFPKLLPLIAWKLKGEMRYMLEGMLYYSGSAVDLFRDLGIVGDVRETSQMAFASKNDLYLIPSFVGLSTPHYVSVPGLLYGLTNSMRREDLVKALLEAIAFRITEIVELMRKVERIDTIKCDGEMSSNDFLLQRIADATKLRVKRSSVLSGSLFGSYLIAGRSLGKWKRVCADFSQEFHPKEDVSQKFRRWKELLELSKKIS